MKKRVVLSILPSLIIGAVAIPILLTWDKPVEPLDIVEPTQTPIVEPVDDVLEYPILQYAQSELKVELRKYRQCDFHYLDDTYYCTDFNSTEALLLSIDIPTFVPETFDCDDIAWYLKEQMSLEYGLNCIGYVEGNHVGFNHAWNVILTNDGVFTWEGELQEWGNESLYDPNLIWF